jgi:hypothetical protein
MDRMLEETMATLRMIRFLAQKRMPADHAQAFFATNQRRTGTN